jgi:hypothetical protein
VPLVVVAVSGAVNWGLLGPWTTRVMRERKHQETRDGKRYWEEGASEGMRRLNERFMVLHGASSVVNLVGLGALVGYAAYLGGRML